MTHPHLTELKKRHAALSAEVQAMQRSPGTNDLEIASLKKRKLALKEEMMRMSA